MAKHGPADQQLTVEPLLAPTTSRRSAIRRAMLAVLALVGVSTTTAAGCDPETFPSD